MLNSLINIFFPSLCLACGEPLNRYEQYLCLHCHHKLPKTHFHKDKENKLTEMFWGRIPIHSAAAYLYFIKASRVQHILHAFKYRNQKMVGVHLGELYGQELMKSPHFNTVDAILPVPLHPKKEYLRGYNQSRCFGLGLSKSMKIPLHDNLIRSSFTHTQTKKSKYHRWANVSEAFELKNPNNYKHKHILIVDDVITTGATMESCAQHFSGIEGIKISLAGIAFAWNI